MRWFGFWLLLFSCGANALVDHLSVNRVEVIKNQPTQLFINIVADPSSKQQLRFYLEQNGQRIPLRYREVNDFQLQITSSTPLSSNAQLLASTWLHVTDDALGRFQLVSVGNANPQDHNAVVAVATSKLNHPAPSTRPEQHAQLGEGAEPALATVTPAPKLKAVKQPSPALQTPTGIQCSLHRGESLWRAAERLAPAFAVGRYGMIWALYDANPSVFNGSPQIMRSDQLRCPSSQIIARWQDEAKAKQQFKLSTRQ
ncbi:hypothetical protein [uncultured Ferrimonas sp.]|uniref:type IV pilus assembly protein FimV n=1 Tax=uncultured Ferrimonas sp. TaxID=432640 RepID=UPI00261E4229|nr:hypothetical protein [uncultured Ferrimonas sp.]